MMTRLLIAAGCTVGAGLLAATQSIWPKTTNSSPRECSSYTDGGHCSTWASPNIDPTCSFSSDGGNCLEKVSAWQSRSDCYATFGTAECDE